MEGVLTVQSVTVEIDGKIMEVPATMVSESVEAAEQARIDAMVAQYEKYMRQRQEQLDIWCFVKASDPLMILAIKQLPERMRP